MEKPVSERRRDTRFSHPAIVAADAILRPGHAVSLLNLSAGGALIECPRPLRPGANVHLQVVLAERRLGIPAHVLRCAVTSLDSSQGVQYRGALAFDPRCELLWEHSTPDGHAGPTDVARFRQERVYELPARARTDRRARDIDAD